ncbi:energy transducer TonB [bacterium]|nr:energy transducer TonB [bacterium]RQV93316.1 MAG: energy transducer TonB [bacterium]
MAKIIGIEGTVIIHALIDEKGTVISIRILQSLVSYGCDEAAENAIRATRWNPAYQRDMPVQVWVAIPVTFQLSDSQQ